MPCLYPLSFILSFCLLAVSFSRPALAVSKGYDASAQVILKDGIPCFFAKINSKISTIPSKTLLVVDHRKATTDIWQIDDEHGTEPIPSSAEYCIKYGAHWPTGVTVIKAKPLQFDVPYFSDIWINIDNGIRFRVKFCLSENVNGKPSLTKWAKDGEHCTNRPLSDVDRPGLLEWIFT